VDTGIKRDHPELNGKIFEGYDLISSPSRAADGNGIDADPDDDNDANIRSSRRYHGSHVAGIIAAQTNNEAGIAGVAPNIKIMPVRVLGVDAYGTTADIVEGIKYAAGISHTSGALPSRAADVINLSLSVNGEDSALREVLHEVVNNKNIPVVCASSNRDTTDAVSPASFDECIAVGAINQDSERAHYSSYGVNVDIVAPGGEDDDERAILSTVWLRVDDEPILDAMSGTSMATAFVSGTVGLIKSIYPNITPNQIREVLYETAQEIGEEYYVGAGLVNVDAAVWHACDKLHGDCDLYLASLNAPPPIIPIPPQQVRASRI
jgi:serine protease